MLFKEAKIRELLSKTIKKQNTKFKEYDRNNSIDFPIKLRDIDELFYSLRYFNREAKKNINIHLRDSLVLGYLAILLTGHLSLALQEDNEEKIEFQEAIDSPQPIVVLICLITQITNHGLSILNLVEAGLDNSARTILRTLEELVYLTIYLTADLDKMKIYTNIHNPKEIWYKNFRIEKINKEISKIELRLGLPDDLIQMLRKQRSEGFEFYSEYIHNSYGVVTTGTYVRSFEDDDFMHNSVFGKESRASISTINRLNLTLFYFNLSMFELLLKEYKAKVSASNRTWRMTISLLECYKAAYLDSFEED